MYSYRFIVLLFFIFLYSKSVSGQANNSTNLTGTIIVAEVGADGIVISADSRALIKHFDQPYGYFDGTAKVTQVRDLLFATTGVGSVLGKGILSIAEGIDNISAWKGDIDSFVVFFYDALRQKLSQPEIDFLRGNEFIVAGYKDQKPAIYEFTIKDLEKNQVYPCPRWYVTSSPVLKFLHYDSQFSCKKLARLAKRGIKKFTKEFKMDYVIGGPISSVQVTPTGPVIWLRHRFSDEVNMDIDKQIKEGKIKVTLVDPKRVALSDSLVNAYQRIHPETRRKAQ
jgi:hypothetical protein